MPTLDWIGKKAVENHHREVPFHLLKDVPELACGDPGSGNLIVEGDNLLALKALLPYYAGQVKCIYIDPPYNTGNEGWVYNDNVNSPEMRDWLRRGCADGRTVRGPHVRTSPLLGNSFFKVWILNRLRSFLRNQPWIFDAGLRLILILEGYFKFPIIAKIEPVIQVLAFG